MAAYLVLARKYRPQTFRDVVGQEHIVRTLSNSITSGRIAHAFLFCGVRGVGKTTLARILAKALNCTGRPQDDPNPCNKCASCTEIVNGISVDVQEIDGASNTSVENIREINENIKYPPVSSKYKIIIIDEVHMISINAFNALLKTLEEPPPHAKFIFATTEFHKVPATINSRCQHFNFRTISLADITAGMEQILSNEGLTADPGALDIIGREAAGSFRDGLSLLDQVISVGAEHVSVDTVSSVLGITGRDSIGNLVEMVLAHSTAEALNVVHELMEQGYDPEQFQLDLVQFLRNLTIVKSIGDPGCWKLVEAPSGERDQLMSLSVSAGLEDMQNLFRMVMKAEEEIKRSLNPWIAIEMLTIRMSQAPNITDLTKIIRKLDSGDLKTESIAPHKVVHAKENRSASEKTAISQPSSSRDDADSPQEESSLPRTLSGNTEKKTPERFIIEQVRPALHGTPDEIWSAFHELVMRNADPLFSSIMEHGNLITYDPALVEIGFNKAYYTNTFLDKLNHDGEFKALVDDFFGGAKLKILTLQNETPLTMKDSFIENKGDESDRDRALKEEALSNKIIQDILKEFKGSSIEDIKILE